MWLPWSPAAFDAARSGDKLVLLFVTMPWSATCAALEAVEFTRPDVSALVAEHFVPVRVNAAARPDISERYLAEGWPTVACLTAAGRPLLGSAPTTADELVALLQRALDGFNARRQEFARNDFGRAREGARVPNGRPRVLSVDAYAAAERIVDLAIDAYDPVFAGFGQEAKIPHGELLQLLLTRSESSEQCRAVVISTLDAILDHLRDPLAGGFFRAARRDWSDPDEAKLIEVQAELIEAFIAAGQTLRLPRYLEAAADIVRFVDRHMALRSGGFSVDGGVYVDANAVMAKAYLRAGAGLHDVRLTETAIATLERIMVSTYRPGAGVAHDADADPSPRGLLSDQVMAAFALSESASQTGSVPHLMLGEELMLYAERVMWDDDVGAFRDRAPQEEDIGLLSDPLMPFALNCHAARVWLRLAALAEKPEYRGLATRTLASQHARAAEHGLFAASYGLAIEELRVSQ